MLSPRRALTLTLTLTLLTTLTACDAVEDALAPEETEQVNLAVDSLELTRIEAALLASASPHIDLTAENSEAIAAAIADAAATTFSPADCVQAAATGNTIGYLFDDCAGPFGLTGLTGQAALTLSDPTAQSVALNLTATSLQVSGADMAVINASGSYDQTDNPLIIVGTSIGAGSAANSDVSVARAGQYRVIPDAECLTLNGTWSITEGLENDDTSSAVTTVSDFKQCGAACPAEGQLVLGTVDSAEQDSGDTVGETSGIVVSFDGSDAAPFLTSDGAPGLASLACAPQ